LALIRNSSKPSSLQLSKQELIDENECLREKLASAKSTSKFRQKLHNTLSSAINIGYWEWDEKTGRPIYISKEMANIFGMSQESLYEKYRCEEDLFDLIHPDDLDHYRNNLSVSLGLEHPPDRVHSFDYRIIRPDGEMRHVLELEYGNLEKDGVVTHRYGAIQDITDRQDSILAYRESEQRYSSLFSQLPLGVQEQDWSSIKKMVDKLQSEGVENIKEYLNSNPLVLRGLIKSIVVTSANDALLKIYGASSVEEYIQGEEGITDWWDKEWADLYASEIAALAGARQIHYRELEETRLDGSIFEVRLITHIVEGDEDTWKRVLTIVEDVTERREVQKKLSYQASHDSLTGLINRGEFERRAERLISTFHEGQDNHALCFMDLDQFKVVNDTCGHVAGDELLRQLSHILQGAVRKHDTLARLGGDEFGILIELCSLDQAERVAASLKRVMKDFNFTWEGHIFPVRASIGLVAINEFTPNLTELMRQADEACYMAKDLGRNRIYVYTPQDKELALRLGQMQWVERINQALKKDQFCLYAQPIVPLDNSDHRHYEMLLRMIDDDGDIILPGAFLPAAERYDLIGKLDFWVIENALALLAENPDFVEEIHFVSINLSGQSVTNEKFLDFILTQLKETGIEANKICFEITETLAITNLSAATTFIEILKEIGCHFALDDFGSGLSSFGYLKNLPVDYLKIDGMFVKDIVDDPIDRAMVKSINDVGHIMGMKTIAEFVENDEIQKKLIEIGVDYSQGYCFGKPQSFNTLIDQTIFKIAR